MNKTILLTDENFEKQARLIDELNEFNVIKNKDDIIKELKDYKQYIDDVNSVNTIITYVNNGLLGKQAIINEVNKLQSLSSNTYKQQFETLIDEVNSQNSYSKEVEEILKQLEV